MGKGIAIYDVTLLPAVRETSLTYNERLAGQSALLQWLVPDTLYTTLATGRVSTLADRAEAGKSGTQSDTTRQPLWVEDGAPYTRPSMRWASGRFDRLATGVVVPTGSGAIWSKVAFIKPATGITNGTYWDIMSSASLSGTSVGPHRLSVYGGSTTTNIRARIGGSNLAQVTTAITAGEWCLVINTWDGTTNTVGLSINGATFSTNVVSGATSDESALNIGSCGTGTNFQGDIGFTMMWSLDLSASANAALLSTIKQFVRDRYRVTVA